MFSRHKNRNCCYKIINLITLKLKLENIKIDLMKENVTVKQAPHSAL